MEYSETVRSPEQLGFDLAKALQFSVTDLDHFRRGILPAASCQVMLGKVVGPLVRLAAFTLLPLLVLAVIVSWSRDCSVSDALFIIVSDIRNVREFAATEGWVHTGLYAAAGIGLLGFGVYQATRIPMDLLADIIAKRVRILDGRINTREEDHSGGSKRNDEIIYYFDMKQCAFRVNRRAFLAIDSGGAYRVYYLPRSRTLVAIEPSLLAKEAEEKERKLAAPVAEGTI